MAEKQEAASPVIAITADQLKAILESIKESPEDKLKLIQAQADANAEANRRTLRPENTQHPGHGVYARPGGELKNPKGDLKYRIVWAGGPLDKDTLTAEEFDLLHQLTPGAYRCQRPDGEWFPVTITATHNPTSGAIESLDVFFATRGQLRHGLPSMVVMCRELIAQAKAPAKVA